MRMLGMTPQSRDRESFGMILHRMRLISQIVVREKKWKLRAPANWKT